MQIFRDAVGVSVSKGQFADAEAVHAFAAVAGQFLVIPGQWLNSDVNVDHEVSAATHHHRCPGCPLVGSARSTHEFVRRTGGEAAGNSRRRQGAGTIARCCIGVAPQDGSRRQGSDPDRDVRMGHQAMVGHPHRRLPVARFVASPPIRRSNGGGKEDDDRAITCVRQPLPSTTALSAARSALKAACRHRTAQS